MKAEDINRIRAANYLAEQNTDRQQAAQRFEQALTGQGGQEGSGGGQGDQQGSRGNAARDEHLFPAQTLPPNVMRLFRQSLEQDLPRDDSQTGAMLDSLLRDIADGVKARRRGPTDRWRLTIRLRPEVLPQTEVEIACTGGELSVALRTASEPAYRLIVDALPALNKALEERQYGSNRATVFLIAPEELQ